MNSKLGQGSSPRGGASSLLDSDGDELSAYLPKVAEIIRHLNVAEKNVRLYPNYSKVVRNGIEQLHASIREFHDESAFALYFRVNQDTLLYAEEPVYEEKHRGKSLSFRMYKDGVRGVIIRPGVEPAEIEAFVTCFKEALETEEDDDDFGTLFWEKDCAFVQLQLIDDTEATDDEKIPSIPQEHLLTLGVDQDRFAVPGQEEEHLRESLAKRGGKQAQGERTFELSPEEVTEIDRLATAEEAYFAIHDFVDVLIELMVADPGSASTAFRDALNLIRNILAGLTENLDFDHAAQVLHKLIRDRHPGLAENQRRELQELVEEFCVGELMTLVGNFMRESEKLPANHAVFKLLRSLGTFALPNMCELLKHHHHIASLSNVLIVLGQEQGNVLARFLKHDDPLVARAMISILLEAESQAFVVDKFSGALQHPDERVRKHAAKVLQDLGDPRSGEHFIPLLKDDSNYLVTTAMRFLAQNPCPQAYEALIELAHAKSFSKIDSSERIMVLRGVVNSRKAEGLRWLRSILDKKFCFTRRQIALKGAALQALAYFEPQEAQKVALRYLARKRGKMLEPAQQVIMLIERKDRQERERKRAEDVRRNKRAQRQEVENV